MLEFNQEHKAIVGSLNKKGFKINKNMMVSGLLIASLSLFSGCAKNVPCDIEDIHAHYYVNEQSLGRYAVSERETYKDLFRTEDYVYVDKEMKELLDFENKNGLFRISDNKERIDQIVSTHEDELEYRYEFEYTNKIPHVRKIGKITTVYYTHISKTGYTWTNDSNHENLTGEQRVIHHMYYGYKVVKDTKGKLRLVESELVDNFHDLPDDVVYIKSDFYKKVLLDNKEVEADYEDFDKLPTHEKELNEDLDTGGISI